MGILGALVGGRSLMIALCIAGVGISGAGVVGHWKGKRAGIAQDKARSDLIILNMVKNAQDDLIAANSRADGITAALRQKVSESEATIRIERAKVSSLRASAADAGRLRSELAAYAAGGVKAGDDTLAACRGRADALAVVSEAALSDGSQCASDAEDLASSLRAMQRAWPVMVPREGLEPPESGF